MVSSWCPVGGCPCHHSELASMGTPPGVGWCAHGTDVPPGGHRCRVLAAAPHPVLALEDALQYSVCWYGHPFSRLCSGELLGSCCREEFEVCELELLAYTQNYPQIEKKCFLKKKPSKQKFEPRPNLTSHAYS